MLKKTQDRLEVLRIMHYNLDKEIKKRERSYEDDTVVKNLKLEKLKVKDQMDKIIEEDKQ